MSNYKDIQKKKDSELASDIQGKREELRKFRFGTAGAGTRDVKAAKAAKKEIARAMTALNDKARKAETK